MFTGFGEMVAALEKGGAVVVVWRGGGGIPTPATVAARISLIYRRSDLQLSGSQLRLSRR